MNHSNPKKAELNSVCKDIEEYAHLKGINVLHSPNKTKEHGFYVELDDTCSWKSVLDLISSNHKKEEIYLDTSLFNPSLYQETLDSFFTASKTPAKLGSFLAKHKNELCMVRILWIKGEWKVQKIIQASWMKEFYSLVRELKEKN